MVNEDSSYTINVHQDYSEANDVLILVLICLGFGISITITSAIAIIACIKARKMQAIPHITPNIQEDLTFRKEHISKCLNNMRKHEFKHIRAKFDQNNCVICFDNFEHNSEVYITNE